MTEAELARVQRSWTRRLAGRWETVQAVEAAIGELLDRTDIELAYPHFVRPAMLNALSVWSVLQLHVAGGAPQDVAIACVRAKLLQEAEFYWRLARRAHGCLAGPAHVWCHPWPSAELAALLRERRGLLLCSVRLGLMRHLVLDLFEQGVPAALAVTASMWPAVSAWFTRVTAAARANDPASLEAINVEAADAGRRLLKALKANKTICIAIEGSAGTRGPWDDHARTVASFLGREVMVRTGVARLAARLGTPLLPVVAPRIDLGWGELWTSDAIAVERGGSTQESPAIDDAMRRLFRALEPKVARHVRQWEGITGLHRLTALARPLPPAQPPGSTPSTARHRDATVSADARLHARADRSVLITANAELYCLDGRTLSALKIPSRLSRMVERLFAGTAPISMAEALADLTACDHAAAIECLVQLVERGLLDVDDQDERSMDDGTGTRPESHERSEHVNAS